MTAMEAFRRLDPEALFEEARRQTRRRRGRVALAALALLVVAGAAYGVVASLGNSANGGGAAVAAPPKNVAIVLLVDVSGSMRATDIKPNRLDATVTALHSFVEALPVQTKIAVVSFSTAAKVVLAATDDHARVDAALASLSPVAGTALGDGLASAVKLTVDTLRRAGIERKPGHLLPATIVLLSDGAQNRGAVTPAAAAQQAKAAGIRVDGVALGTAKGAVKFGYGQLTNSIPVPPDPKTVAQVAHATGGESFIAPTAARLAAIYRALAVSLGR